jgi:hypothetical protein
MQFLSFTRGKVLGTLFIVAVDFIVGLITGGIAALVFTREQLRDIEEFLNKAIDPSAPEIAYLQSFQSLQVIGIVLKTVLIYAAVSYIVHRCEIGKTI